MFYRNFRPLLSLLLLFVLTAPLSAVATPTIPQPIATPAPDTRGPAVAAPEVAQPAENMAPDTQVPAVAPPAPASAAAAAAPTKTVYTVRRGDTLNAIARRYGVSVQAILAANGLRNPNYVYVGQRLVIPSSKSQPAPSTNPKTAPQPAGRGRWIDVNLSTQSLTAFSGSSAVFRTRVSTGVAGRRTPVGRFKVRTKVPSQTMSGPGYRLPGVPWVMYFAGANAIHGTYWHHNFGRPMSHGCVNVTIAAAKWLYNWASIGTPVITHY